MLSFKDLVAGRAAALSIIAIVNCPVPTAMLFVFSYRGEDKGNSSTGHTSNCLTHVWSKTFWDEVR